MSSEKTVSFVIVGGGIAGVSCAEMLLNSLEEDSRVSITLITPSPIVKNITNVSYVTKMMSSFDVEEISSETYESKNQGRIKICRGEVTSVNIETKIVVYRAMDSTDNTLHYDKLCLCHGARPKLISNNHPHILGIRDTESVFEFQKRLEEGDGAKRIVLVGNGGIATELVHELARIEIFWAVKDDSISKAFVDAGAGEFLYKELKKGPTKDNTAVPTKRMKYSLTSTTPRDPKSSIKGGALGPDWHSGLTAKRYLDDLDENYVRVEFEVTVSDVWSKEELISKKISPQRDLFPGKCDEEHDWNLYVELTNGQVIGCDFLVSATGVIPNGDLIPISGLQMASDPMTAIKVNDQMLTNIPDIFAAGDVCSAEWEPRAKHWFQMRLWTQARQMGMYAAQCMLLIISDKATIWSTVFLGLPAASSMASLDGNNKDLDFCFEMFTHCTKFFGFKVILLGLFNGQGLLRESSGDSDNKLELLVRLTQGSEYVKAVMQNGRMQGAVLIGDTDLEETFENLILNQMDLSHFGEDLLDPNIDIEDYFD